MWFMIRQTLENYRWIKNAATAFECTEMDKYVKAKESTGKQKWSLGHRNQETLHC